MSKKPPGSRTSKQPDRRPPARQGAAAARARVAAAERRSRLIKVGGAVAAVLAVVAVLVVVKVATGAGGPKSGEKATAAGNTVVARVTSVSANVLDEVGTGSVKSGIDPINAPALTSNGKPRVLYVGAEYCPYCATERWAVAVALSRFGTFHGLGQTASSPSDVYPNTATLSFHGATYTSKYLSFTGKETQSNQVVNGQYTTLDKLSAADQRLVAKYDQKPYVSSSGIPFIDFGGKYLISGATYNPQVLQGKSHAQIAAALSDPSSAIAKGADGSANLISAALCRLTDNAPTSVCTSSGVTAAAAELGNAG